MEENGTGAIPDLIQELDIEGKRSSVLLCKLFNADLGCSAFNISQPLVVVDWSIRTEIFEDLGPKGSQLGPNLAKAVHFVGWHLGRQFEKVVACGN